MSKSVDLGDDGRGTTQMSLDFGYTNHNYRDKANSVLYKPDEVNGSLPVDDDVRLMTAELLSRMGKLCKVLNHERGAVTFGDVTRQDMFAKNMSIKWGADFPFESFTWLATSAKADIGSLQRPQDKFNDWRDGYQHTMIWSCIIPNPDDNGETTIRLAGLCSSVRCRWLGLHHAMLE